MVFEIFLKRLIKFLLIHINMYYGCKIVTKQKSIVIAGVWAVEWEDHRPWCLPTYHPRQSALPVYPLRLDICARNPGRLTMFAYIVLITRLFRARRPGTAKYLKDLGLPCDLLVFNGKYLNNKLKFYHYDDL